MLARVLQGTVEIALLLAVLLVAPAKARMLCLALDRDHGVNFYPAVAGDKLHLTFRHSIYGSLVEEQLHIGPSGFQTVKLRYSELRLAEFYGHDSAIREGGWWVVDNPGRNLQSLDLRVSHESSIRIAFGGHVISLGDAEAVGCHARLWVSACPRGSDG